MECMPSFVGGNGPRHAERGTELFHQIQQKADFLVQLDHHTTRYDPDCGLYIFDAFGKLGALHRLADMVFIGGSLIPKVGGHNMREAILLQCLPIVGPYMANFSRHKAYFSTYYSEISDAKSLADAVAVCLRDPVQTKKRAVLAQSLAESQSEGFVDEMLEVFDSVLMSGKAS